MIEYKNGIFGLHGEGFSCLLRIGQFGNLVRHVLRLLPLFRGTCCDSNQQTLTDFGLKLYIVEEETTNA